MRMQVDDTVWESGRFIASAPNGAAAAFANENLLTLHGGASRLAASIRSPAFKWEGSPLSREVSDAIDAATELLERRGELREWLFVRDYDRSARGRSLLFLFQAGHPLAVAKLRKPAPGASLSHEAEVLAAFHSVATDELSSTVPRAMRYVDLATEGVILLMSLVPGRPMWISMQRSLRPVASHAASLVAAGEWLGAMQRATRIDGGACLVHGDFWPRNLLLERRGLSGVVDWEHGQIAGMPWLDAFDLALVFATDLPRWRRVDPMTAFRSGFLHETTLSHEIAAYLRAWSDMSEPGTHDVRKQFDEYLDASEAALAGGSGWKAMYPWSEVREELRRARRSVFSG